MDTASASPLLPHLKVHDGRKTMRAMADALQKLNELGVLSEGQNAQVKISEILFPDRKTSSGVVSVVAPLRPDRSGWAIWMPSSRRFRALNTMGIRQTYGIALLDNVFSDRDGNVDLGGGQFLHAVEFMPTPFYRFTDLQHARFSCLFPYFIARPASSQMRQASWETLGSVQSNSSHLNHSFPGFRLYV